MKARNPSTGNLETVYVKALDSMPVGTEVDFDGQASDIPVGWEQVSDTAKVLWTNPNPTSTFASQNINIDSSYSNCNYYEILFKAAYNSNLYYNTGKIEIDKQTSLIGQAGGGMYYRDCGTIVNGVMLIANAYLSGTTSNPNNGALIPYKIIGYK